MVEADQIPELRRFQFVRKEDLSGISGTGVVAEGVEFTCGKVAFTWLSHMGAVAVYDNIKTLLSIHGHGGKGEIRWLDSDPSEPEEEKSARKPGKGKKS